MIPVIYQFDKSYVYSIKKTLSKCKNFNKFNIYFKNFSYDKHLKHDLIFFFKFSKNI